MILQWFLKHRGAAYFVALPHGRMTPFRVGANLETQ
jgi:hypothetical protein